MPLILRAALFVALAVQADAAFAAFVTAKELNTQLGFRSNGPAAAGNAGVAYILGAVDAMNGHQFCIPSKVGAEEIIDIVAFYLRQHQSNIDARVEASWQIKESLKAKFSCAPIP